MKINLDEMLTILLSLKGAYYCEPRGRQSELRSIKKLHNKLLMQLQNRGKFEDISLIE
ncbi:hypothetical protein [Clostridium sp. 'White wine YQ']|uniref:hypothetical protein n=1 Tax=Clostridium sp. 'White wine YQ' TaxID=3027474 RepID=UPI00236557D1|nr:hypothetical protein [Clostridium sp. 'White wine YQ']MDD7793712.1 hypothetical protein [Clostridium sp. 'White wine YQ']